MTDTVRGHLEFDVEEASEKVNAFFENFGLKAAGFGATFEAGKKAVELFTEALRAGVELVKEFVEVAERQEKAELRLEAVSERLHLSSEKVISKTKEFGEALEALTGTSVQVTEKIEGQLLAMGVYSQDLDKATLAAVGFARAHDVDIDSATKIVGKVIQGNTDLLKRYGDHVHSVNEAINKYADLSKIAEKETDTLGGQINLAKLAYEHLEEGVGGAILKSEGLKRIVGEVIDGLDGMVKWVNEHQKQITGFFDTVATVAEKVVDKIKLVGGALLTLNPITGALGLAGGAALLASGVADEAKGAVGGGQPAASGPVGPDIPGRIALEREYEDKLEEARKARIATRNRVREEEAEKEAKAKRKRDEERQKRDARELAHAIDEFLGELDRERRKLLVEDEKATNETLFQLKLEAFESEKNFEKAKRDEQFQQEQEAFNKRIGLLTNYTAKYLDVEKIKNLKLNQATLQGINVTFGLFDVLQQGVAQSLGAVIGGIATGAGDIDKKVGGIFGSLLSSLGDSLISMSIAALAAEALALIPFLEPLVGPPGVGAGAAAVALGAGIAIKAAGAALGGASSSSSGGASAPSVGGASGSRTFAPSIDTSPRGVPASPLFDRFGNPTGPSGGGAGSSSSSSPSSITNVTNVDLRGATLVGGNDRAARRLQKLTQKGDRLRGMRVSPFAGVI